MKLSLFGWGGMKAIEGEKKPKGKARVTKLNGSLGFSRDAYF